MAESVVQGPRRRRRRPRRSGARGSAEPASGVVLPAFEPGPLPPLNYPAELPVSARADDIAAAIASAPVVIVSGQTGSGKTTQLPKICAQAGRGAAGRIGHTQPRRLAATSVAQRLAQELGTPLGQDVGFKVRFSEQLQPGARFKIMTDGMLLAETRGDPALRQYDTLIIDEAHERSLNIDFLLGYLKRLLSGPRRDDLKVIITSATIDAERFAQHFAFDGKPAPVIEVSGRLYPVQVRYQSDDEVADNDDEDESDIPSRIERALTEVWREGPGDVLVFLPGEREIRDAAEHLRRAANAHRVGRGDVDIVPLFARLSAAEQNKVFSQSSGRRVVLATNVAETSLTVPGIRYVIDTGTARVKRYRLRGKVEQLQIEPVSQAAANQRAGRCGRVANGVCIRLYSQADYEARARFTDPEVLRSSLASVILQMKSLRLGDVDQFPFVDAPPARAINDGYALLTELGAVDAQRQLTRVGAQLARLPLDPRLARMLLAANEQGCLRDMLVLAAALSTQDPRDRPMDAQQAADQAHKPFADATSDFMGLLRLWRFWRDAETGRGARGESRGAMNRRLQKLFLSARRLREWSDVHRQLRESVRELKWSVPADDPAAEMPEPEVLHRALLTGLLGNLGHKPPDEKQYLGTHQTRFVVHPSSGAARKPPRWLMAAEMVDTGRLYARTVAAIQPGWIEQAGAHLIRRHWSEPFWAARSAQAMRYETGLLYGLTIYSQRRVPLAPSDPETAREMFIRHGLVEGDWRGPRHGRQPAFIVHNEKLIESIQKLEEKIRRPDLLVDQQFQFDWFSARVPADVVDARSFEKWYRKSSRNDRDLLKLTRDELLRKDSAGVDSEDFPRAIVMRGVEYALDYRFEPGAGDDGVTMTIPLSLLNQVDANRCEWLVPGLLVDKVQALVKSLPQRMRRHLVPVPEYARDFATRYSPDGNDPAQAQSKPLTDCIRADARQQKAVQVELTDFRPEVVPRHLVMNFRLVDRHGRQLAVSRSLAQLRASFGEQAASAFREAFKQVAGQLDKSHRAAAVPATGEHSAGSNASADSSANRLPSPPSATGESAPGDTAGLADTDPDGVQIDASRVQLEVGRRFVRWPVTALPEILEITEPGTGGSMIGFPAFVDRGNGVTIEVFDEQAEARTAHRDGVLRLLGITLRSNFKVFFKQLADYQKLVIAYARIGADDDLRAGMTIGILRRAVGEHAEPQTRQAFEQLVEQARPRLTLLGQELARSLLQVLDEYGNAQRKIHNVQSGAREAEVRAALEDCREQLDALICNGFIAQTPAVQFPHLPRYLKAIVMRLERIRADPGRDTEKRNQVAQLQAGYQRLLRTRRGQLDQELVNFRWLIEELRVSLFAQSLRTPTPVSVKRLNRMLSEIQANNQLA